MSWEKIVHECVKPDLETPGVAPGSIWLCKTGEPECGKRWELKFTAMSTPRNPMGYRYWEEV